MNGLSVADEAQQVKQRSWLREPLFHFLLLGVVLFTVYHYLQPARTAVASSKEIQLTLDELAQLDLQFQSQWQRKPTSEEFHQLIENKIQVEILYREALAMGLDKNDEIVRRRMAQKMQFLAEDVAAAREPTTAELKLWFTQNTKKFAMSSRISFRHLYFSPDSRREHARDDAAKALTKLTGEPENSKLASPLADSFMLQDYYRDRTPDYLAKEFGPQFTEAVEKLTTGSWQGPIESGFGWHLVFVDTVVPGRVPVFEEIESDVKTAWLNEQKAIAWQKTYEDLSAKYTILLPVPAKDASSVSLPASANTPSSSPSNGRAK